jgi:hypothetical protein
VFVWEFDNTIDSYDDWYKKYHGTFVQLDGEPAKVSCGPSYTTVGKTLFNMNMFDNTKPKPSIKPFFPKSQWLRLKANDYAYLRRIPERQYQRSFNSQCYALDYPHLKLFNKSWHANTVIPALQKTKIIPFNSEDLGSEVIHRDYCMLKTGENTFSIVGLSGIVALGRHDRKEIWTLKQTMSIVKELIGDVPEWKINSLGLSII